MFHDCVGGCQKQNTTEDIYSHSHRKGMGKAVARRSSLKLAKECIENTTVRNYIIKEMGKMVRNELKTLCSMESVLRSMNLEDLKCFQWEALYEELESHTPNFLSFLVSFTETRTPRCNQKALICICAILFKYRFNLVHKLIGLILYAGHSLKKVIYLLYICMIIIIICHVM